MTIQYLGLLAVILMAVVTATAIAIAFYLYRWRKVITSQQALFVPEELISQIRLFRSELNSSTDVTSKLMAISQDRFSGIEKNISKVGSITAELFDASTTWQTALDERDAEIRKLRSGYDLEVFRRFIARFARVRTAIDEFKLEGRHDQNALDYLSRLLDDAFDECGVEQFSAVIGEDYRNAKDVEDNPKKIASPNPDNAFRIAETITPGFRSRHNDTHNVIIPARVSIYVYQAGAE